MSGSRLPPVPATLAARQRGIVTREQARRVGVTDREIDRRIRDKPLVRIHEEFYRHAAAPVTVAGRLLAGGSGAAASHRSAAALHGLRARAPHRPEVTVARCRLPRHRGLTQRTNLLEPGDVT